MVRLEIKYIGGKLEKGELSILIMSKLREEMYGYQLMSKLKEESGGTYKASAGAIYPRLELLAKNGYLSISKKEGKDHYKLSQKGRSFLKRNMDLLDVARERFDAFCNEKEIEQIVERMERVGEFWLSNATAALKSGKSAEKKKIWVSLGRFDDFEADLRRFWET